MLERQLPRLGRQLSAGVPYKGAPVDNYLTSLGLHEKLHVVFPVNIFL